MNKKELKKRISKEIKELNNILNQWNPIGGTPDDEYCSFLAPILKVLHSGGTQSDLDKVIKRHLSEQFGLVSKSSKLDKVTDTILNWWNKKNQENIA